MESENPVLSLEEMEQLEALLARLRSSMGLPPAQTAPRPASLRLCGQCQSTIDRLAQGLPCDWCKKTLRADVEWNLSLRNEQREKFELAVERARLQTQQAQARLAEPLDPA